MLRSLLALLLLGACAHGPTTSTAVRYAATDEVTTMALRESITRSLRDVRRGADLEVVCVRVRAGDPPPAVLAALAESIDRHDECVL